MPMTKKKAKARKKPSPSNKIVRTQIRKRDKLRSIANAAKQARGG